MVKETENEEEKHLKRIKQTTKLTEPENNNYIFDSNDAKNEETIHMEQDDKIELSECRFYREWIHWNLNDQKEGPKIYMLKTCSANN